jgi:hypothetical protein
MIGLNELSSSYATDKNQTYTYAHGYTKTYEEYFTPLQHTAKNVLEIGVQSGESLRLWQDFFVNAQIYGIDIDPNCQRFNSERQHIFIGHQRDVNFLNIVAESIKEPIDIIIDDGSHLMEDYLVSFEILFPKLKSEGLYIIEDINYDNRDPVLFNNFISGLTNGVLLDKIVCSGNREKTLEVPGLEQQLTNIQLAVNSFYLYDNIIFIRRQ